MNIKSTTQVLEYKPHCSTGHSAHTSRRPAPGKSPQFRTNCPSFDLRLGFCLDPPPWDFFFFVQNFSTWERFSVAARWKRITWTVKNWWNIVSSNRGSSVYPGLLMPSSSNTLFQIFHISDVPKCLKDPTSAVGSSWGSSGRGEREGLLSSRERELKITFPFYGKGTEIKQSRSRFAGREREWNFPTGREVNGNFRL